MLWSPQIPEKVFPSFWQCSLNLKKYVFASRLPKNNLQCSPAPWKSKKKNNVTGVPASTEIHVAMPLCYLHFQCIYSYGPQTVIFRRTLSHSVMNIWAVSFDRGTRNVSHRSTSECSGEAALPRILARAFTVRGYEYNAWTMMTNAQTISWTYS